MNISTAMVTYNNFNLRMSRFCSDQSFLIRVAFLNLVLLIVMLPMFGTSNKSTNHFNRSAITNLPDTCVPSGGVDSGIVLVHPQPGFQEPFEVFCDQKYKHGGWIVIQRRYQGSVNFFRGWQDYERGFGNMNGEFWLGLRKIHELTYSNRYELHVLLEDWDGTRVVARYSHFLIAGPEEKYKLLSLGTYSGNAGDSLGYSLNAKFSTFDANNNHYMSHCAQERSGAWWYKGCSYG